MGVYDKIFRDPDGRVRYHYVVVDCWRWIAQVHPAPASDVSDVRKIPLDQLDRMGLDRELIRTIREAERAQQWQSLDI